MVTGKWIGQACIEPPIPYTESPSEPLDRDAAAQMSSTNTPLNKATERPHPVQTDPRLLRRSQRLPSPLLVVILRFTTTTSLGPYTAVDIL
ncbi:unnamed protein product [Lota lota]